jgi:hypothetical protein
VFAIPGILSLILFIYVRPQEFAPELQRLPFLYLFFALAVCGFVVDLRLRVSRPLATPQLPWVILLWIWSSLTMALQAPQTALRGMLELAIALSLYMIIAHGVQGFRGLQVVCGWLVAVVLFLSVVGIHQGVAPFGCVMIDESNPNDLSSGVADGRPCEIEYECYAHDPEPGAEYMCERVGLFGTSSVGEGRVRYRGVLQDPNELALAVCLGLAWALAFYDQRRSGRRLLLAALAFGAVLGCVMLTKSRGGQLVFMTVLGAYFVRRFGWRGIVAGAVLAVPALMLAGGGGRADASASTEERLEAWATGVELFRSSPAIGVGHGQFGEYHYLTAHNSYILTAAELGIVGMVLWGAVLYLSIKIPLTALRRYAGVPGTEVARTWSMAILAALCGLYVGAFFLSFAYHYVLWIHIGLAGALYSAIRSHDPDFRVRLRLVELVALAAGAMMVLGLMYVYLRLKGY